MNFSKLNGQTVQYQITALTDGKFRAVIRPVHSLGWLCWPLLSSDFNSRPAARRAIKRELLSRTATA